MKDKKSLALFTGLALIIPLSLIIWTSCSKTPQKEHVDFLLDWKMAPPYAPYLLAKERGYYANEGIDVTFIEGQGAETSAKLIGQGKYTVGTCNAAATAIAVDNGIPILSVAIIDQAPVTAVFSLKASNITKPEDLIGKKLGVRYYDISHKEYLAMMKAAKVDSAKVTEIGVGFDLQPLLEKQVDALYNYAFNMPVQLKVSGYPINSILVKDYGVQGFGSNIIVNKDWANQNPDLLSRFIRATRKGWEDGIQQPQAAIDVLAKYYPETNTKVALAALTEEAKWVQPGDAKLLEQSVTRWQQALNGYHALGMIKHNLAPEDVFTTRFSGK